MRLPHIPQLLTTATAQRWEPAEMLKALLAEELAERERSALATRRAGRGTVRGQRGASA